jgi:phage portal protein BeeE
MISITGPVEPTDSPEQRLEWLPFGLSMVDSRFLERRNFPLREIARAFDVPAHKLPKRRPHKLAKRRRRARKTRPGVTTETTDGWG